MLAAENATISEFDQPSTYLYEPNTAILKSGGFKLVGRAFSLKKLHEHTHLYTSDTLIKFTGRRFKVKEVLSYNKKALKHFKNTKVNVTTRNFPDTVTQLRKKHQLLDGGEDYLFLPLI